MNLATIVAISEHDLRSGTNIQAIPGNLVPSEQFHDQPYVFVTRVPSGVLLLSETNYQDFAIRFDGQLERAHIIPRRHGGYNLELPRIYEESLHGNERAVDLTAKQRIWRIYLHEINLDGVQCYLASSARVGKERDILELKTWNKVPESLFS